MHPQSPPLTIDSTVLKESDDLDILGVTFDSKLTFEKHLRSVSRAAFQGSPGGYSMINCSSGDAFGVLSCQFWNCSAVWCLAAETHLKLLDSVVSGACFLAGGVLNCDLSHRRSVAVLCMLYKIRCNPKHPLCSALPVPYVPVRVTRGALIAHRYTFATSRCRTSQYRRTFIRLSVSLWNDLVHPVFDEVGLAGFKSRSNAFLLA